MNTTTNLIRPFGISVFVIKKNAEPQYLLIRRCSKHLNGDWQMVSGKCEEGEAVWGTVLREIREETGLSVQELYSADFVEVFYELRYDMIMHIPVFVAFVEGDQKVVLSPEEHDAYEWLTYEEARERLAFEKQQQALDHIQKYFVKSQPNKRFKINTIDGWTRL